MRSVRWVIGSAVFRLLLGGLPARAADQIVHMKVPPPVQQNVAAMPLIADPADDAERRINAAVRHLDARVRKAAAGCTDPGGSPGWTRSVDVPMHGPGYISYVIRDDAFCGGAHPSSSTMSIVYDLGTGRPVDWTRLLPPTLTGKVELREGVDGTRMVTLASNRLYALFVAGYDLPGDNAEGGTTCKQAVQNIGTDGPPAMMVWLDAKLGGLAVQYDLSHVVQACAIPVVIPVATLRADGAKPTLLEAVEAARQP